MDKVIRVAICDDAQYLCEGFREQFELFSEVEMAGMAYSSAGCPDMLRKTRPDLLLLDIRMEYERAGIDIIPRIKDEFPEIKILMLTSYDYDNYVFDAFANGADDYCDKNLPVEEIVKKICAMVSNQNALQPQVARKLINQAREVKKAQTSLLYLYNKVSKLSAGEYELLRDLYYGASYMEIAEKKCIEVESVMKMAKRLLKRTGGGSLKELLAQLKKLKIFEYIDSAKEMQ